MKLVLSAADAAAVKVVEFDRTVDTSNPESKQPTIDVLVRGPSGPKKPNAVTHICAFERFIVIARRNGQVLIGDRLLTDLGAELVGLNRAVVSLDGDAKQKRKHALIATAASGDSRAMLLESDGQVLSTIGFTLRAGLASVVNDPTSTLTFASAGSEALPDVFKLHITADKVSINPVWSAESLPNDRLDLPVPNLVSALTFVDRKTLVAVTSKGSLRVYNIEAGSQPAASSQVSKHALKCVSADPSNPGTVLAGDANTIVSRWSVDPLKLLGTYKGLIGSTRSLSVRGDYVAMGGLDRYLRVYHITKRSLAGKVYIGDEIWALELLRTDDEENMSEIDNMWEELDTKRRKVASQDNYQSGDESPFEGFED